ncbi:MAG: MFS transporter [Deltaproteobacteria bacterium]|nr:MAG: MFS transporter [Deltaproteobacteria bacterium]
MFRHPCEDINTEKVSHMNVKIWLAFFIGLGLGLTFMNIPPGLTLLMAVYGVTYTGISFLISALLWSHALMQIPGGLIADRLGIGRTLLLGLTFMALGNLMPAAMPSLSLAVVSRVVTGIGTGLTFVTTMKFIAQHAPGGRAGMYQSFFAGIFSLGNILAYYLVSKALHLSWQWIYLIPGMFCLSILILWTALGPESQALLPRGPLPLGQIARIRAGWILGLYHALSWGTVICLGNWIPSLLAEFWADSTATQLAWGAMLVMLISGLGRISGGFILLKVTPLFLANGSILLLTLTFWGLFSLPSPGLLLSLALLAAWVSCINFGAFFHLASTVTTVDSLATLFGFVNFLANLGAVLFTIVFGLLKDTTGTFTWGFGILGILGAGGFLLGKVILSRDCSADSCYQDIQAF